MATPGTTPPAAPTSLILGAFAAIYLVWGSTYLAIRVAVETLPPFLMASVRYLVAGSLLFGLLRARGSPWPGAGDWRLGALVGGLMLVGGNGLVSWAEQTVASGLTALILATTPMWFVLLEWLRPGGTRPTWGVALGLAVGFAGVGLLVGDPGGADGRRPEVSVGGTIALLVACLSWAAGSLVVRHARRAASPWMGAAVQMICGGVGLLGVALVRGEPAQLRWETMSTTSVAALGYLIVFGSWVGFGAYIWLLNHSTPARVSTYAYVNPVVAVLLGWLILGEPLTPRVGWAALVIVGGVLIVQWPRAAAARAPAR